ncbi:MAG: hypothetical protein KDD55_10725, partial [Bdellovibrionales bacterium]|nr:hypothetical protein [Bdellovibrionales bacterium]
MSLEILKKRVGLGSHQGEMTLLRKIIRTVRRLLNRFFGTGPYQISTFANIATEVPEGPVQLSDVPSKAILSSECGETFTLFEVESTKPIICEEPKRELYYARDCAVLGFKGALYDPSTRTAFSETLEDWYEPIEYHTA